MKTMVIESLKWIISVVARRKVIVMLGGVKSRGKALARRHVFLNNFNGLHDIVFHTTN